MTITCILFQQLYSSDVTARKWPYVTTERWKLG